MVLFFFFLNRSVKEKEFQVASYVEKQNFLFIKVSGQGEIIPQVKQYSAKCFQNPIFFSDYGNNTQSLLKVLVGFFPFF